jgi:cytochrome c oxidase cbb3-type subunit III
MGRGQLMHIGARLAGAAALLAAGCEREERLFRARAPSSSSVHAVRLSPIQPGESQVEPARRNEYEENAYAISQGKQFFQAFNCLGCHSNGGGGMGPALMDDTWRYGSDPEQILATILEGRPNGMPSFRGHITDDQAWKLVSYVRSLGGLTSTTPAPGRDDHMKSKPPEHTLPRQDPKNADHPT